MEYFSVFPKILPEHFYRKEFPENWEFQQKAENFSGLAFYRIKPWSTSALNGFDQFHLVLFQLVLTAFVFRVASCESPDLLLPPDDRTLVRLCHWKIEWIWTGNYPTLSLCTLIWNVLHKLCKSMSPPSSLWHEIAPCFFIKLTFSY